MISFLALTLLPLALALPTQTNTTNKGPFTTPRTLGSKRGIVFGDGLQVTSIPLINHANTGWFYDWAPDAAGIDITGGQEFVPMLWTTYEQWDAPRKARWDAAVRDNSRSSHLLGFNEPDMPIGGIGGSQLIPSEAAAAWRAQMQQFENPKFSLGSPGVSSAPHGIPWMKDFLAECGDCEIDFFAAHYYGACGNPAGLQGYLQEFKAQVVGDSGKKVWVTEMGAVDCPTVEMERDWISTNVQWLDAQDWIERYSYFGYPGQHCGGVKHFLNCEGGLTCLAKAYLGGEGERDTVCS